VLREREQRNEQRCEGRNASYHGFKESTGHAEVVSDDFPRISRAADSGAAALLIVEDDLRGSLVDLKLCTHLPMISTEGIGIRRITPNTVFT